MGFNFTVGCDSSLSLLDGATYQFHQQGSMSPRCLIFCLGSRDCKLRHLFDSADYMSTVTISNIDFIFTHYECECRDHESLSIRHQKILQSGAATRGRCFVAYIFYFPFVVVALLRKMECLNRASRIIISRVAAPRCKPLVIHHVKGLRFNRGSKQSREKVLTILTLTMNPECATVVDSSDAISQIVPPDQ